MTKDPSHTLPEGILRNIRHIPAPVTDVMCTIQYSRPVRVSRCLNYIKTDRRWLIELQFNSSYELALFERFLVGTPLRLAEYQGKVDRHPRYFCIDSRIPNSASEEDVERWILEELPSVCAAIATFFPLFLPPTVRCILDVAQLAEGKGPWAKSQLAMVLGTASDNLLDHLLQSTDDFLSPFLSAMKADCDFKEAAMYCGQSLGFRGGNPWASLYRAFEIVSDRFGGSAGMVEQLGSISKNDISRFTRTLNHQEAIGKYSRHARNSAVPPPDPMTFKEAVEFILSLLKTWCLLQRK